MILGITPGTVDALIEDALFTGKAELTRRAYARDLDAFARFCRRQDWRSAVTGLIQRTPESAHELVESFRKKMLDAGLSVATVNRRLSPLRAIMRLAEARRLIDWPLTVPNCPCPVRRRLRRSTLGFGPDRFAQILLRVNTSGGGRALRDAAVLRLLHDLGLSRSEVSDLDVEHVGLADGSLLVLEGGETERRPRVLPAPTSTALGRWLDVHPWREGALFVAPHSRARLSNRAISRIVARRAAAGL